MFAKNLESLLFNLCPKSDVSPSPPSEFAERFDTLRRNGRLPRGRVLERPGFIDLGDMRVPEPGEDL